ncbi:hypothetical protein [Nocardioides aquiterrae]|uniref:Uncharacterized protein n=1 Tax=Nocardioides aquiterrae TaxID=203799 RepID=A0ABN1UDX9_9ACTN
MPIPLPDIDETLHDRLVGAVRRDGPTDVATLTRRVRLAAGDHRVTETAVRVVLDSATLLVHRPDGRVAWLGDVLDGIVLTHRVRGSLADRCDLWLGQSVQPFLAMAALEPLPLATGGEARIADTLDPVLIGPPGWLPAAEAGDLVSLTWTRGRLSVGVVPPDEVAGPAEEEAVRCLLGERCRTELWWAAGDDDWVRHALLIRALSSVRLEDPDFLSTPHAPLDQLLYDPLGSDPRHHWRDVAAWRPEGAVSFAIAGMPMALDIELRHRAERYGMTLDQFVIAILGHLAWRTPFAEDLGPWEDWVPEDARPREARVAHLRSIGDGPPGTEPGA